jgi:glyoxylase-like metal-dependent hydrolase (beta-lactamase superfamily II)
MESQRISDRGVIFPFNDPYLTNVYVIDGRDQIIVCDTSLGSEPMSYVRSFTNSINPSKQIVVFNSHFHYDHIWGNCAFESYSIYSHERCYTKLKEENERALKEYSNHKRGDVKLVLPNQIFSNRVIFEDGNIEFFYSPGHTDDSASCIDYVDKVLFVADNVESPIPFLYDLDIEQYIATLTNYLTIDWNTMIASHDPIMKDDLLLRDNIEYLEKFNSWSVELFELDQRTRGRHIMNLAEVASLIDSEDIESDAVNKFRGAQDLLEGMDSSPMIEELLTKLRRITNQYQ